MSDVHLLPIPPDGAQVVEAIVSRRERSASVRSWGSAIARHTADRRTTVDRAVTRIFFPLRTSVEFFPDPRSVEAAARAKEASILYDEVVFEAGLYDIGITEVGSFANWREPAA